MDNKKSNQEIKEILDKQRWCEHKNKKYSHTNEDWYEGDADDIYICQDCGKWIEQYIGR